MAPSFLDYATLIHILHGEMLFLRPMEKPSLNNHFLAEHVALLGDSYHRLLGHPLITGICGSQEFAESLFHASFAVVSHDTEGDPVFNYANAQALTLFEMNWDEFTRTPSRLSAEPINRQERSRLLKKVTEKGYIDHYQGVRISSTGTRFMIENAVVWNLIDRHGNYKGQAACFSDWRFL